MNIVECNFIDLEIQILTNNRTQLAYRLPSLGGLFADLCRGAVCLFPGRDCQSCLQSVSCDWHRIFGQALAVDPEALKRHQKPPLPFVFSFPILERLPASPGVVSCGLVVIGCAISSLDMLLDGFNRFLMYNACKGHSKITQLFSRDFQGTLVPLEFGNHSAVAENLIVMSLGGILESRDWCSSNMQIKLLSPLKLRADGHQVKQYEFGLFVRALFRRVSSLIYYYDNSESTLDFKRLSFQADAVILTKDAFCYETCPAGIKKLSGITGQGCFRGDFNELLPFLVAGSYFHVGKSAAFGLGKYSLSVVSDWFSGSRVQNKNACE